MEGDIFKEEEIGDQRCSFFSWLLVPQEYLRTGVRICWEFSFQENINMEFILLLDLG